MRAAWWWIDRWRKSTAFTDMTAEEQGLYRNLLDEIWNRENGVIPDDPRILARASGDEGAWQRSGEKVLRWMRHVPGGWTNDTALEIIGQSLYRAAKQRRYRDRKNSPVVAAIIDRDGRICGICGQAISATEPYDIDHIIPAALGGHPDALDNLQLAHKTCNYRKGKQGTQRHAELSPMGKLLRPDEFSNTNGNAKDNTKGSPSPSPSPSPYTVSKRRTPALIAKQKY
jgi:hypothetical protein